MPITDYQIVHKGDPLYRIEQDDYDARVAQAQAQVASAEAGISVAAAQVAAQEAQIGTAVASTHADAANLDRARQERERQSALLGTESGLPRAWEAAAAQEQQVQSQLKGDQDLVGAQTAQVGVQRAQLAVSRATLDGRRAALRQAKINLGYTRVVASEDGVVGPRLAFEGQYASVGMPLITLVPLNQVWALAYYREEQVNRMAVGQPATVRVDAYPGVVWRGHVQSFDPTSQAADSPAPPDRAVGSFTFIVRRIPVSEYSNRGTRIFETSLNTKCLHVGPLGRAAFSSATPISN